MNQAARGRNADLGDGKCTCGGEETGLLLVSKFGLRDVVAMDEDRKPRFSLAMWIVLIVVVLVFLGLTLPMVIRRKRDTGQTETVNNARQIGFALFEFEREYGRFPDETTAAMLRQKNDNRWTLGNSSSNDYFRQLIAAGIVDRSSYFYAKTEFTKKPDPRIEPSEKSLAPGEVGFGYLMNGKTAFNTEGNPARPLVCSPLAFDGKTVSDRKFDPTIHDRKAVILRMDNSVTSLTILKESKQVALGGGKSLLDTGPDTVWGDSTKPVIIPPVPKP